MPPMPWAIQQTKLAQELYVCDLKTFLEDVQGGEMKIYVASSWRNSLQPLVVSRLRAAEHEVYNFKNPGPGDDGFHWSEIDAQWEGWDRETFRSALNHPVAVSGFGKDFAAMEWADAFVLVMPCGRSAHLELGWAIGAGKPAFILLDDGEPELMYRMATALCVGMGELLGELREAQVAMLQAGRARLD